MYNDYDNANLFNDHVVASLIKDFRATAPDGFLLYFSDHGEEVYDTPPYKTQGRNEDNPTRPMYTVPFLLWTSEKWHAAHPRDFSQYVDRKYSLAELIHTWSDLAGLTYDGYDPTRSLVNPQFRKPPAGLEIRIKRMGSLISTLFRMVSHSIFLSSVPF